MEQGIPVRKGVPYYCHTLVTTFTSIHVVHVVPNMYHIQDMSGVTKLHCTTLAAWNDPADQYNYG